MADDIPDKTSARTLTIGVPSTATFEAAGDTDYFKAQLEAGVTYLIRGSGLALTTGPSGLSVMNLLFNGPGGLTGLLARNGNGEFSFTAAASGEYIFDAAADGQTGDYGLTLTTLTNDVAANASGAAALAIGATLQGSLGGAGQDVDWIAVTLVAGASYEYKLNYTTNNTLRSADVSLLDASGATLKSGVTITEDASNSSYASSFTPSTSGIYYIRVGDTANVTGTYSLNVTQTSVDDHGSTPETSTRFNAGATVTGNIESGRDTDYFKLALSAGNNYQLDFAVGNTTLTNVTVLRTDGQPVLSTATGGAPVNASFAVPASGDYFVKVEGTGPVTFGYSVKVAAITSDTAVPVLTSFTPANNAGNVDLRPTVAMSFSEPVSPGSGSITLTGPFLSGGSIMLPASSVTMSGNQATFKLPGTLLPGASYSVTLNNAFVDAANNPVSNQTHTFTTIAASSNASANGDYFLNSIFVSSLDGGAGRDVLVVNDASGSYSLGLSSDVATLNRREGLPLTMTSVERIYFSNETLAWALDISGVGGQAYRMYQAAFNRTPDSAGLGFWISVMDRGMSLKAVAEGFVASAEFKSIYGAAPTALQLVTKLYENVLHRPGEAAGIDFWTKALAAGVSTVDVLAAFSESPENQTGVASVIGNGFSYTLYG
jgi:hypothetical protein